MRPSLRRVHMVSGSTKKKKSLAKKKKKIEKQMEVVDEDAELFRLLKLRPEDVAGLKRVGDEELFSKGHANCGGECVVCLLPMPLDPTQIGRNICCMNMICLGCALAAREKQNGHLCPFCRAPRPNEDQVLALTRTRVAVGDPCAYYSFGYNYFDGDYGLPKNSTRALLLWTEGARLGSVDAHHELGFLYESGAGGAEMRTDRAARHYEMAAMAGHPSARHYLGVLAATAGQMERALNHYMISAKMGSEHSLRAIQEMIEDGDATEGDCAEAVLGYQNSVGEMKSAQRDEALKFTERCNTLGIS